MPIVVTVRARGDVAELERRAAANPAAMQAIIDRAKTHGVISHVFHGTDDGDIMVLDEWPAAENFQAFFDASPEIKEMMQEIGVTERPEIKFWRELDTHDRV